MSITKHRIKELRIQNNLSQNDVAKLLNITPSTVSRYESGMRGIPYNTVEQLATVFKVPIVYLLGVEENVDYNVKESGEYISSADIKIIKEIKKQEKLYEKLLDDPARTVAIISKKIK